MECGPVGVGERMLFSQEFTSANLQVSMMICKEFLEHQIAKANIYFKLKIQENSQPARYPGRAVVFASNSLQVKPDFILPFRLCPRK